MDSNTPGRLHWKEWATLIISAVALISTAVSAYFSSQSASAAAESSRIASSMAALQTKTIVVVNCDVGKNGFPDYLLSLNSNNSIGAHFNETLGYFKPSEYHEYRECLISNHGAYPVLNLTISFSLQFENAMPNGNGTASGVMPARKQPITIGEVAPREAASIWIDNADLCKTVGIVLNQNATLLSFPFDSPTQYSLPGWTHEQFAIRPIDSTIYNQSRGKDRRFYKDCT